MTQMFVFTAGNPNARQHLRDSIERPVDPTIVFDTFPAYQHEELKKVCKQGNGFYAWGAIPGHLSSFSVEGIGSERLGVQVGRLRARLVGALQEFEQGGLR
jgi:hypothetical protein